MSNYRFEALFAKMFLILASLIIGVIAIELLARFYLWHVASEDDFRILASINQIKDRYGDELFVQDVDKRRLSWSPHRFLGHFPTPNYRRGQNRHNSYGFRGEEFNPAKSQDTFRIIAIGGSTTYSIDVQNYQNSYPDLLAQHLHENGFGSVEVLNAGAAGYTSNQNLINLQLRVLPLEPDLIIVYQGFNDINARFVYPHSRYLGDSSGSETPFVRGLFMPDIIEYSSALRILSILSGTIKSHMDLDWHVLSRPSSFYGTEFERQFSTGNYPDGVFREISAATMLENNPPIHFERNISNMIAVSTRNNVKALLVTMVLNDNYHKSSGNSKNSFYTSNEYTIAMKQHNDITRRIALSTGTTLFDLAAIFPDDHSLFTDGLHMTENGNRLRAQFIGDFVIRQFSEDMRSAASSP